MVDRIMTCFGLSIKWELSVFEQDGGQSTV